MTQVALSTMWMQHRHDRVLTFATEAEALGFDAIELSHEVTPAMVADLRPGDVAIASLHYPAPTVLHDGRGLKADKLLACVDEHERLWAVEQGRRSIEYAREMGARTVCIHLGWVETERHLSWALEQRFLAGQRGSPAYAALCHQILTQRAERQLPHFTAARRSLDELAQHASQVGVRLGLENRRYFFEIPTLEELRILLVDQDPEVVGFWYDTGHAKVLENLGFCTAQEWLETLGHRVVGVHFHDSVGLRDHLLPGLGEIDFASIAPHIPSGAARVCEFDWYFTPAELQAARSRLQADGCIASAF